MLSTQKQGFLIKIYKSKMAQAAWLSKIRALSYILDNHDLMETVHRRYCVKGLFPGGRLSL